LGGGGNGAVTVAGNGVANSGGGGGGAFNRADQGALGVSGSGGSGIVIVRYAI